MDWFIIPSFILFGITIAMLVIYFCAIRPKLKKIAQQNTFIEEENQKLEEKRDYLLKHIEHLQEIEKNSSISVAELDTKVKGLQELMQNSKVTAEEAATNWYTTYQSMMEQEFERAAEKLSIEYSEYEDQIKQEYLDIIKDNVNNYQKAIKDFSEKAQKASEALNLLKQRVHEANENAKREAQIADEDQKHKIILSDEDWAEINKIREIIPSFREKRPLRKMLWEGYYRDATSDLLDRILDPKEKGMGIYKIKNLINQKVYIGQATSFADRLKTHVKAGLGIDANNNLMYKDMQEDGIRNFTFEIMEYCKSPTELNNGEKYWIDYFGSSDYGYNMTRGGAAVSSKVAK